MNESSGVQRFLKRTAEKKQAIGQMLASPGGRILLEALERSFLWDDRVSHDELERNAGAVDVLRIMRQFLEDFEQGEKTRA